MSKSNTLNDTLKVEIGEQITQPALTIRAKVFEKDLPEEITSGKAISCLYKCAYSGLGKAYSKLTEWLGKNKYHSMYISYEYYYNDPKDVPEEELLTKVVLLIK